MGGSCSVLPVGGPQAEKAREDQRRPIRGVLGLGRTRKNPVGRAWPLLPFRLPLLEDLALKLPLPLPTVLGVTIVLPEASVYAVPPW